MNRTLYFFGIKLWCRYKKDSLFAMNVWFIVIPIIGGSILLLAVLLAVLVPRIEDKRRRVESKHETCPKSNENDVPVVSEEPSTPGQLEEDSGVSQLYGTEPSRWPAPSISAQPMLGCANPPCGPETYQPNAGATSSPSKPQAANDSSQKFSCDYLTGTCTPDKNGNLTTCDACEKRTYFCDHNSWTCRDVGFLRDSASQCQRGCYPDLRVKGDYTVKRSDTNANGAGSFCDRGRFRKVGSGLVDGTNVPNYEWEDMSCVGYRCCQSQFCDPSGMGQDPYSVSVCASYSTEAACDGAIAKEVPAYCEWTGSACQAASGEVSVCAACTKDTECPGKFGAFKCISGECVAQGSPKCDVIHKEYRTDEVVPDHLLTACKYMFNKDRDTAQRICRNQLDGNACAVTYFDRMCQDRYGKTWVTERTHCGPRSAPQYPTVEP